ncbi:MAG: bacillithiol biosynthesis deacetylase BshB1 [Candidatus Hydrogenedentes bacterium]|nr:bacillithiol biosynthesis deacetylase BshB1 [Candidatus Hydrogenedentota bacterium]
MNDDSPFDVLAVGAHPDDVEVGIGGIVANLVRRGKRVAILDLTEGEMGTRGTVAERRGEATAAAAMLGVSRRVNAKLPDGGVANDQTMRRAVVTLLRELRPAILIAPMNNDRHPDHDAAHFLVRDANYLAGLARLDTAQPPHRAAQVYYYRVYVDATLPGAVIDISDTFDTKLAALRAYVSQFFNPAYAGAETYVSSEKFWNAITTRAAYWGNRIGAAHGEPIYCDGPIGLKTLE